MEYDSDSIVREAEGKILVESRLKFDNPVPDTVTGNAYRFVAARLRITCDTRTSVTLQRILMSNETEILREETNKNPSDFPVRSGSLEDRLLRQICRPVESTMKDVLTKTVSSVNEITAGKKVKPKINGNKKVIKTNSKKNITSVQWGYQGNLGPEKWSSLDEKYHSCDLGKRQSPIKIGGGHRVEGMPLEFDFPTDYFFISFNGSDIALRLSNASLNFKNEKYFLDKVYFKIPSEVEFMGKTFPMSVQFHFTGRNRLILAIPVDIGYSNQAASAVLSSLPLESDGIQYKSVSRTNFAYLLPSNDSGYFNFLGSLPFPPCTEGVEWIVMKQSISLSLDQIQTFSKLVSANTRPFQNANDRIIKEIN